MLRTALFYLGLSACAISASVVGCGDDGATDGEVTGGAVVGLPPPPGPEKPADGPTVAFGVSRLFIGSTDPNGSPNPGAAWKNYGFNLDGIVTTNEFSNHCKPTGNTPPKEIFTDGNDGIDNSFGQNILPIIVGFASDAEEQLNQGIAEGSFTLILELKGLGADAEYNPIPTQLLVGSDGVGDEWLLVPEILSQTEPPTSEIQFPNAYLVDNTWVSGPDKATLSIALEVGGYSLSLPISNAIVAAEFDAAHTSAKNGIIAGVLETELLISELKKIAGSLSEDLCTGSTFDSIANQLRGASDIMANGTQDPNATCNGISIGLGFDLTPVTIGGIAEPSEPGEDPCSTDTDTGTGTETGTGTATGTGTGTGTGT
jgi:hypothetical protein